jgi:hypothetical protein
MKLLSLILFTTRTIQSVVGGGYIARVCDNEFDSIDESLGLGDDDFSKQTIPFSFPFFGINQEEVYVSSNGFLTFDEDGASSEEEDEIKNTDAPNDLIAVLWDDLRPPGGGAVYVKDVDDGASFIVEWNQVAEYYSVGSNSFQVELFPSGVIEMRYGAVSVSTDDYTVGVENKDGTEGLQVDGLVGNGDTCVRIETDGGGYRASVCDNKFDSIVIVVVNELDLEDDDSSIRNLSFTFPFFGNDQDEVYVSSNGFLTFDESGASSELEDEIKDTDAPNDLIAVLWADHNPPARKGGVFVANGASFIVEWKQVLGFPNEGPNSFQVELFPSGVIEMRYGAVSTTGYTVGVENADGTEGLQVDDLVEENAGNTCIRFEPSLISCPDPLTTFVDEQCQSDVPSGRVTFRDEIFGPVTQTQTFSAGVHPKGDFSFFFSRDNPDGTSDSCTWNVAVEDQEVPVLTCPIMTTISTEDGECFAYVPEDQPSATDNCDNCDGLLMTQNPFAGAEINAFSTTVVTFVATDTSGNSGTCTWDIVVADNEAPTVTCPMNTTISTEDGVCFAYVPEDQASVTDNCNNGGDLVMTQNVFAGHKINTSSTTVVTFDATDTSGNSGTCNWEIVVADNEGPTALCQDVNVTLPSGNGTASITADDIDASSTDNCGIINKLVSSTTFGSEDIGANIVNLTVTDLSGNENTCSSLVTVVDVPQKSGKKSSKKDGDSARRLVQSGPTGSFNEEKRRVRGS